MPGVIWTDFCWEKKNAHGMNFAQSKEINKAKILYRKNNIQEMGNTLDD